jgi:hypothetical protein
MVLAMRWDHGFGIHWGPRLLLPAFPAFVASGFIALRPDGSAHGWSPAMSRAIATLLIGAGLLSGAHSIRFLAAQKGDLEELQNALLASEPRVIVTTHAYLPQHLAALWDRKTILLMRQSRGLGRLGRLLYIHGVRRFLLVWPETLPRPSVEPAVGLPNVPFEQVQVDCTPAVAHRGGRLRYFTLKSQTCTVGFRRTRGG